MSDGAFPPEGGPEHPQLYRVYLKYLDSLQQWVPKAKTGSQFISVYISVTWFRGTAPTFTWRQSVGTRKKRYCSHVQLKMKRRFTNAFFVPIKSFVSAPRPWRGCDSPWSAVSMRSLTQVGGNIWAFVVNFYLTSNNNSTVIELWTCSVNILWL